MKDRRKFLKNALTVAAGSFVIDISAFTSKATDYINNPFDKKNKGKNPYNIDSDKVKWIKENTIKQLKGCRVKGAGGTMIHTPDGVGNYKALWTRDSYYMVEYAGDLMDAEEIKASIYYLINGQREDGCIPDRVNAEGLAVYSPGPPNKPMADHAVDNAPFMAMMVCSYVNQHNDKALFIEVEPKLLKGLEHIRVKENGLVYNDPRKPECVYGFTDIVKKTGHLLFSSLLYFKANLEMYQLCKKYDTGNANTYRRRYEYVRQSIFKLWDEESGMFWAADKDCKQIDIWGSAYAVAVGITTDEQTQRIAHYLVDHYDETVLKGQIRHLTTSEGVWDNLFKPRKEGEYQNGAYWATPLAWLLPIYDIVQPGLSKKTLDAVLKDFQENGINECINDGYIKVPNFVVSATNVYALTR
tara:strand:+ start:22634 stop:23872 length:1239 start_codon:yes stop_codon:yes gene_type:complete